MRPADTSPEAWQILLDLQRQMSPGERLEKAFEYSAFVRSLAEGAIRRNYPNASDREILLRAARLRLGRDLFRTVYGNAFADE